MQRPLRGVTCLWISTLSREIRISPTVCTSLTSCYRGSHTTVSGIDLPFTLPSTTKFNLVLNNYFTLKIWTTCMDGLFGDLITQSAHFECCSHLFVLVWLTQSDIYFLWLITHFFCRCLAFSTRWWKPCEQLWSVLVTWYFCCWRWVRIHSFV